jgi:hypothetical protein
VVLRGVKHSSEEQRSSYREAQKGAGWLRRLQLSLVWCSIAQLVFLAEKTSNEENRRPVLLEVNGGTPRKKLVRHRHFYGLSA